MFSIWIRTQWLWYPPYPPVSEGIVDITARGTAQKRAAYQAFVGRWARVPKDALFVCRAIRFGRNASDLRLGTQEWRCSRVWVASIREILVRKHRDGPRHYIDVEVENESGERAHVIRWHVKDPVGALLEVFAFDDIPNAE